MFYLKQSFFALWIFAFALVLFLSPLRTFGQCAGFSFIADDVTACVPQIIRFKVTGSPPVGTTFQWDFGAGFNPGLDSSVSLFSSAGSFDVRLELSFPNNTKCVVTKSKYITVGLKPTIELSLDKSVFCSLNDSIIITDNTAKTFSRTYIIEGAKYENVAKSYVHRFSTTPGTRSISAIVVDSLGCQSIDEFKNIVNIPPAFSFDFSTDSTTGCTNRYANFKYRIFQSGQIPTIFNWNFQNGTPNKSTDSSPLNIFYASKDSSNVSLKIKTKEGCEYEVIKPKYITLENPIALDISVSLPNPCVGQYVEYKVNNRQTSNLNWQFFPADFQIHQIKDSGIIGEHRTSGNKVLRVSQNYKGCVSQEDLRGKVTVVGPQAIFFSTKRKSCFSLDTFEFVNTSREPAGEIINYRWYVLNQNNLRIDSSRNKDYKRIFNGFGVYSIMLIASSNVGGCSDTLLLYNYIELNSIKVSLLIAPKPSCKSQDVTLKNLTPLGATNSPNIYSWRIFTKSGTLLNTSNKDSFDFAFSDTGVYSVSLVVRNVLGCYDSVYRKDSIVIVKPSIKISISDSLPCVGEIVTFYAELNPKLPGIIHFWEFKNTTNVGLQNNAALLKDSGDVVFTASGVYAFNYSYYARMGPQCKDTVLGKAKIKVSGTKITINSTNVDDCVPLNTQLNSNVITSNIYKFNFPNTTYTWRVPDTTVTLATPNLIATSGRFNKEGAKNIRFVYRDRAGCIDSTSNLTHFVGVISDFSVAPVACFGGKTEIQNSSALRPTKFKWYSDSTGVLFLPNDSAKDPTVVFNRLGRFPISLIAYKLGCSDTVTTNVNSIEVKANFFTNDSNSFCAPTVVNFIANGQNITRFNWNFGDGDSAITGAPAASHVYFRNTPASGIDIRLIVENNYGCIDTLIKKNYVKVIGPIPRLKINNIQGCEPLKVEFINQSSAFNRFFLDFGDGSVLDSTSFSFHNYRIVDENKLAQFFKIKLVLYDQFGCFVEFIPNDSIYVIQNAKADFAVEKDTGCSLFRAKFINLSKRASSFAWDFTSDGFFENSDQNPFAFYQTGTHTPTLVARNVTGCNDTLRNHLSIFVRPSPKASFVTLPDTTCYNFPIYVSDNSKMGADSATILKWNYNFGEELKLTDTSSNPIASNIYNNIGTNVITLTIENEFGCRDSVKKAVVIRDTLDPLNNGLTYISVENNNELRLNWHKSNLSIFKDYDIYRDEANVLSNLYNSKIISDTTFLVNSAINVNNRRYCFLTKITDTCLRKGPRTEAHCNVFLRVSDTGLNANQVRWTHYEGWPQRAGYLVFRKEPNGIFKQIAALKGNENVYIDDSLCNINYCYYVVCLHPNGVWKSTSNHGCNTPEIGGISEVPLLSLATVNESNTISLDILKSNVTVIIDYYQIFRSNGGDGSLGLVIDTTHQLKYIDQKAKTNLMAYTYHTRLVDICNIFGPISNKANTIFLSGINLSDTVNLAWNSYLKWTAGIKKYVVYMRDKGMQFQPIGETNPTSLKFNLSSLDLEIEDSIGFMVAAIKDSLISDTSFSNKIFIAPKSRVYVPNAFSPNGDNLNEVFKPISMFLYNDKTNSVYGYNFEIYSRWGEKVFYTNDVSKGWDGNYLGKPSLEGVYLWRVDALGIDGVYHTYKGTFTLIK